MREERSLQQHACYKGVGEQDLAWSSRLLLLSSTPRRCLYGVCLPGLLAVCVDVWLLVCLVVWLLLCLYGCSFGCFVVIACLHSYIFLCVRNAFVCLCVCMLYVYMLVCCMCLYACMFYVFVWLYVLCVLYACIFMCLYACMFCVFVWLYVLCVCMIVCFVCLYDCMFYVFVWLYVLCVLYACIFMCLYACMFRCFCGSWYFPSFALFVNRVGQLYERSVEMKRCFKSQRLCIYQTNHNVCIHFVCMSASMLSCIFHPWIDVGPTKHKFIFIAADWTQQHCNN